jgi:hypothetical protein
MTQPAAVFLIGLIVLFASGRTEAQTDLERAQNLTTCLGGRYPILCKRGWLNAHESRKVEIAERRENLKTCLTGRYPTLCNKTKLSPEEAAQMVAAERNENLKTCLTGHYKVLCKKSLLSESEGRQVLVAEQAENLRTCLTGRDQLFCEKSSLTKEQLAHTQLAEANFAKGGKQDMAKAGVTRSRRPSSSGCESGHWIESISSDGQIVKLEDSSIWKVDSVDTVNSALWLPITDIVACDDKLINTEDNEIVSATRLR